MSGSPVVLRIEPSCDETGAGLVRGGVLLGQAVASSMDEYARCGGVVPEITARAHVHATAPVIRGRWTGLGSPWPTSARWP